MTRADDLVRLRHMLDAAQKAVSHSKSRSRDDLDSDELFALAMTHLIEIVGEAARSVSHEVRNDVSSIPWREIIGTRDRLIHGYASVNLDILWAILMDDLPPLIAKLELAIASEERHA